MITLGLVNNMPEAAVRATERQFDDVLAEAADGLPVQVRWFSVLRPERHGHYEALADLWGSHLDGLIVTGTEPRAASLPNEPYWQSLTDVVDWAARNTASAIWSCLAAHAAVLHLDGIRRHRLPHKVFGIFELTLLTNHALLANAGSRWRVPHSRWNDLQEADLCAAGYTVLARSASAGVDTFAKRVDRSLFLFLQSHPEYDAGALMREYRRDIGRYHLGQQVAYPKVPRNYFDRQTAAALDALGTAPIGQSSGRALALLQRAECPPGWAPTAVRLYRNWLLYLQTSQARQSLALAAS